MVPMDKASEVDFADPASFPEATPAFMDVIVFHRYSSLKYFVAAIYDKRIIMRNVKNRSNISVQISVSCRNLQ